MSGTDAAIETNGIEITIKTVIPLQRISDLLCSAFEGGSNYWYEIKKFNRPPALTFRTDPDRIYRHLDYPLNPGGSLIIATNEGDEINGKKEWTLDLESIKKGLEILQEKYPVNHWADFIGENDDANTGDAFLQCCCFGDIELG